MLVAEKVNRCTGHNIKSTARETIKMPNSKTTGIIIQARMGSTRLPGKMGRSFYNGKTLLELILTRLMRLEKKNKLVVATSRHSADDYIAETARNMGISIFRGSEEDVLQRFINAAEQFDIQRIIRICADNPFLQLKYVEQLIDYVPQSTTADYVGFRINGRLPAIRTHLGFFPELVSLKALKQIDTPDLNQIYREHVTNYFYSDGKSNYVVEWIDITYPEEKIADIRLTIDVERDFDVINNLYQHFIENDLPDTDDAILHYLQEHPTIKQKMKESIEENEK